jgi:hypothetical protein
MVGHAVSAPERWSLPGPSRFIGRLLDELRAGRQVIIVLPRSGAAGDVIAVSEERLGRQRRVDRLNLGSEDAMRLEPQLLALRQSMRLDVDGEDSVLSTSRLLAAGLRAARRGLIVDVRSATDEDLARWGRSLDEYAAESKNLQGAGPEGLVTVCHAEQLTALPKPDVVVRHQWWWGVIDRLDVLVSLQSRRPSGPDADIRLGMVVELAGFDLDLAEHLLQEWDGSLALLPDLLRDFGARIGRFPTDGDASPPFRLDLGRAEAGGAVPVLLRPHWDAGTVELWDSAPVWHRSVLADVARTAADAQREIRRLVWRAQVAMLLPSVEFARHAIARGAAREVQRMGPGSPLRKRYPTDASIERLDYDDLGKLLGGLRSGHRRKEVTKVFGELRWFRNEIAHVNPLEPANVLRILAVIQDARKAAG